MDAGTELLVVSFGNWLVSCETSQRRDIDNDFLLIRPHKMIGKAQFTI